MNAITFPRTSIPLFPNNDGTHASLDWHVITSDGTIGTFTMKGTPPTTTASQNQMPLMIPARLGMKARHIIVQGAKGKKLKRMFTTAFETQWAGRPTIEGPLMVWITYAFPHKKSAPKKILKSIVPYEKVPDSDNVCKAAMDSLQEAKVIINDFKVTTAAITRVRVPEEYVGIWIYLTNLQFRK